MCLQQSDYMPQHNAHPQQGGHRRYLVGERLILRAQSITWSYSLASASASYLPSFLNLSRRSAASVVWRYATEAYIVGAFSCFCSSLLTLLLVYFQLHSINMLVGSSCEAFFTSVSVVLMNSGDSFKLSNQLLGVTGTVFLQVLWSYRNAVLPERHLVQQQVPHGRILRFRKMQASICPNGSLSP